MDNKKIKLLIALAKELKKLQRASARDQHQLDLGHLSETGRLAAARFLDTANFMTASTLNAMRELLAPEPTPYFIEKQKSDDYTDYRATVMKAGDVWIELGLSVPADGATPYLQLFVGSSESADENPLDIPLESSQVADLLTMVAT